MNVLVTGGTGFIGQHVVRQLVDMGIEVTSFTRKPPPRYLEDLAGRVDFEVGDVRNPFDLVAVLRRRNIRRIVHMVSLGGPICQSNPGLAYQVNIGGARVVLDAARVMGIERVVYASSASVYGNVSGERVTEDSPKAPVSVYGMTKLAVEHLGFTYAENFGLDFVAVRPCMGLGAFRVGGAGKKLTDVARLALEGAPVRMKGGDQTYEILHVTDSARAFALAASKDTVIHKAFHVGTGRRISLLQVAEAVRRHVPDADIQIEPGFDKAGSDRTRSDMPPTDLTRARQEGWVPVYTVESAIDQLIEDFKAARAMA